MFFLAISNCYWFIFSNAFICLQLYLAFLSVEHIMRDVSLWLAFFVIYMLNGASFFFIVVYAHYVSRYVIMLLIRFIALRYALWLLGHYFLLNDLL